MTAILEKCDTCQEELTWCYCEALKEMAAGGKEHLPIPVCPTCWGDESVHCSECGEDWMQCDCESLEFYCMNCSEAFVISTDGTNAEGDPAPLEIEDHVLTDDETILFRIGGVWYWESGDPLKCYCLSPKQYACHTCHVRRADVKDEWGYWDGTNSTLTNGVGKSLTSTQLAITKATKAFGAFSSSYGDWDYGIGSFDRHYYETFHLDDNLSVKASSLNNQRDAAEPVPDFGLYADWGWRPYWRNEMIHWPDFDTPYDDECAYQQIEHAFRLIKANLIVEVGCIGGHGRTGTILACLLVLTGMDPKEAVHDVRKRYCKDAIEMQDQEWWVEWFAARHNGTDAPPKPEKKPLKVANINGLKTETCSITDHWTMWKEDAVRCVLRPNCTFYSTDVDKFKRGIYSVKDGQFVNNSPSGTVVDGYVVPKSVKQKHDAACKRGCTCDMCRYLSKGFSAFLEKVPELGDVKDGFVYTKFGWETPEVAAAGGSFPQTKHKSKGKKGK